MPVFFSVVTITHLRIQVKSNREIFVKDLQQMDKEKKK